MSRTYRPGPERKVGDAAQLGAAGPAGGLNGDAIGNGQHVAGEVGRVGAGRQVALGPGASESPDELRLAGGAAGLGLAPTEPVRRPARTLGRRGRSGSRAACSAPP